VEKTNHYEERNEMSSQDMIEPARDESDTASDSVASKLSKELSNWRRRRTVGRSRRDENSSANQSESARTIKVRGHETLVVRKAKLTTKPTAPKGDSSR
jgi:hypothetical protein